MSYKLEMDINKNGLVMVSQLNSSVENTEVQGLMCFC